MKLKTASLKTAPFSLLLAAHLSAAPITGWVAKYGGRTQSGCIRFMETNSTEAGEVR